MKGWIVIVIVFVAQQAMAQNWQEWTQQKKTQRKYLLQQIAGLKVYLDYAAKGYTIAQTGLTTISKIKRGDLDLHDAFFASLKAVNPTIASSAKVVTAFARGVQLVKKVRQTITGLQSSGQFTPEEVAGYKKVLEWLLLQCTETVDELTHLVTSGHYQMSDYERLRRIDEATKAMEAHYAFCVEESAGLGRLAMQRATEEVAIQYSKKLNAKQ